jgi:hypothetical protein
MAALSEDARTLLAGNTVAPVRPDVETVTVAELLGGTSTATEITLSADVPSVTLGVSTLTVMVLQHTVCAGAEVRRAAE